ncbi:expressed unknown protein [Seminavis robusta]|uniref:Uncharacterized protein n=1 Tax=Seminavis robusta TaxID=568900 RepID=A0A9N8EU85_9STRA|nr:expressed unknown protein [Seminavis robusta]|eukprot:Sro1895_g303970.1 n/a (362) ;mRNA; f:1064-2149
MFGLVLHGIRYDICVFLHKGDLTDSKAKDLQVDQQKPPPPPQNSTHATVMGMAYLYPKNKMEGFITSLRRTGYQGNIIMGISETPDEGVVEYLKENNVMIKTLKMVNCSIHFFREKDKDLISLENKMCVHPHPDLKIRWGRFALMGDWLEECQQCQGPVLVSDIRDTFFQRDPFGPEAPPVKGLQVFEEHTRMRTTNWLVQHPVEVCKKIKIWNYPMLCSGTTIGTRETMLQYLRAMAAEGRMWMKDKDCCCTGIAGDDQSIHNWLYYTGGLPMAEAQQNRMGLVNTVGNQGHYVASAKKPFSTDEEEKRGAWLGQEFDQTDLEGYFTNLNGERSFVVHQYDRYGGRLDAWLRNFGPLKGL